MTQRDKMMFELGSSAEAMVYTTTSSFLLLFYNQARGLAPEHVGVALGLIDWISGCLTSLLACCLLFE